MFCAVNSAGVRNEPGPTKKGRPTVVAQQLPVRLEELDEMVTRRRNKVGRVDLLKKGEHGVR